jgi:hypothetical protein
LSVCKVLGLIGFAQKVVSKRVDASKACAAFLVGLCVFKLVLGGMMCDASTETLGLIRDLDTERVCIADVSELISTYLHHLAWMFDKSTLGVLSIGGHTAFIIQWLESRLINFSVGGGKFKSIGGSKVPMSTIVSCLHHMQAWMQSARQTCRAEFPNFELICLFGCFKLPKSSDSTYATQCLKSDELNYKLDRLAHVSRSHYYQDNSDTYIIVRASVTEIAILLYLIGKHGLNL